MQPFFIAFSIIAVLFFLIFDIALLCDRGARHNYSLHICLPLTRRSAIPRSAGQNLRSKAVRHLAIVLAICFATCFVTCSVTQAAGAQASAEDVSGKPPGKAEIIAELEKMRLRIAELEAQLQKQNDSAAQPAQAQSQTLQQAAASEPADPPEQKTKAEPFAFADWTWLNGNPRTKQAPFDSKFFTPEIRVDADYIYDLNHPKDNTIGGSSEVFRANELQLTQLGVGGDFHYDNVRARVMTQLGLYSQTTPRNDASTARGQWNLADAYRYLSEAYGGYHIDALHGINVDAGIFMSYVGLFSYYNFDNWAYQPSYVSSNTPWFFNGVRVQIFPTEKLKIEPWFTNGWQSYDKFNNRPGLGFQVLWRPAAKWSLLGNQYFLGRDTLGVPGRTRFHTDNSVQFKYYEDPNRAITRAALSLTLDAGCESGGGVSCLGNGKNGPKQSFLGFMVYDRLWFDHDRFAFTAGGGAIDNPGRYLVLLPPINGATAASGTPYFTENPGDPFKAWDVSGTLDYMPSEYLTFRWEYNHRATNVPYWTGAGGLTPPGGNSGAPGSAVAGWQPDLRKRENRLNMALLVKF
jgi:hypothetical protein